MNSYYLLNSQGQTGPYTSKQISEMWEKGILHDLDYLWREGLPEWITAGAAFAPGGEFGHLAAKVERSSPEPDPQREPSVPTEVVSAALDKFFGDTPITFDWNSPNGRIGVIAAVLAILLIPLVGFVAGNGPPSAALAEEQFKARVQKESDRRMSVVSFRKTNGARGELFGAKIYLLEYEAEIVFLEDCYWYRGWSGKDFPGTTETVEWVNKNWALRSLTPKESKEKGDRVRIRGDMVYEKTEKGWVLTKL
ncbi:MAG TPA: DUF4339 domain-containing protein [Bacteroidia bacterium]|nr:DUF4339 domain-containing protein [Bacteroidia bacterium]